LTSSSLEILTKSSLILLKNKKKIRCLSSDFRSLLFPV